jgi:CSLREA domain-containing protein
MCIAAFVLFSITPAYAATITVNTTADENGTGPDCSLREAIRSANDNAAFGGCTTGAGPDTIEFDSTVFATLQTINLTNGDLVVTSPITFVGPAANVIVNQSVTPNRVMRMESGPVTMTNMTIQGGSINASGSGIVINNNTGVATNYIFGSGVIVRNNSNTGSDAFGGGITAFNDAQVYLQDGMQLINNTGRSGGGIFLNFSADLFVNTATISGNTATVQGGGIRLSGTGIPATTSVPGSATITNATITGNSAGSAGGGVYLFGPATATITGGSISTNNASFAGGIAAEGNLSTSGGQLTGAPTVTITGTTISGNTGVAGGGGGGATVGGNVTMTDVTVSGNQSTSTTAPFGNGGGFSVSNIGTNDPLWSVASTLTINGTTTFDGNTAVRDGGGVYVSGAGSTATATSGTFTSNSAARNGGAMAVDGGGAVNFSGTRIQSNTATTNGGAFFQAGTGSSITVTTSCIVCNSDNAVSYSGGALPMTLGGNWWGSVYGPYYSTSTDGLQCSHGDSLNSANPLAQYGITVSTPSTPTCETIPVGNWSATPLATCTGSEITQPSSISPVRVCPRP